MASKANWAKMTTTTGGIGSLTLGSVSGFPTFAQAFGTGSTSIEYVIESTGLREAGTADFNGTTGVLSGRTVTQSWNGTTYGTAALNFPTSGVTVFVAPIHQSVAAAVHTHEINDTVGLQTALDDKSGLGHTHVAADITDAALVAGTAEWDMLAYAAASTAFVKKTKAEVRAGLEVHRYRVTIQVVADTTEVTAADGKLTIPVPSFLNGMVLTAAEADVITAGTTGGTLVQVTRLRAGTPADMLSTGMTIDSAETSSTTGTAGVVNAANDDLLTGDRIRFDVDTVSTTKPRGLYVTLTFGPA